MSFQAVACSFIKPLAMSATTSIPSPSLTERADFVLAALSDLGMKRIL